MVKHLLRSEPRRRFALGRPAMAVLVGAFAAGSLAAAPASAAPPFTAKWLPAVAVDASPNPAEAPDVGIDAHGQATAIWRRFGSPSQVVASTHPISGVWAAPVPISGPGQDVRQVALDVNRAGDAVAAWRVLDGGIQAAFRPVGGTWGAPEVVSPVPTRTTSGIYELAVGLDEDGNALLTWVGSTGDGPTVRVANRPSEGGWTERAEPISAAGENAGEVRLAFAPDGKATAIWSSVNGGLDQILARTYRPNGSWDAIETLPGDPTATNLGASVAFDGRGNQYATWESRPGGIGGDKPVTIMASTRPAFGTWQSPVVLSTTTTAVDNTAVELSVNRAGYAIASWYTSLRTGFEHRGYIATKAPDQAWETPTPLAEGQETYNASVSVDDTNNAVALWTAGGAGGQAVRANTRLLAGGQWRTPVTLAVVDGYVIPGPVAAGPTGDAVGIWTSAGASVGAATYDATAPVVGRFDVPATGQAGQPVNVAGSASDAWATPALSWTFGDGGTAAGASPSHTFAKAGTYEVQLTAVDDAGNASSVRKTITVVGAPATGGPTPTPGPKPPASTVPASLKGKALTLDALVKLKGGQKTCPRAKALTVTVEAKAKKKGGKKPTFKVAKTKLTVTKVGTACKVAGSVTLKTAPKRSQAVTVRITSKTLKTTALKAARP